MPSPSFGWAMPSSAPACSVIRAVIVMSQPNSIFWPLCSKLVRFIPHKTKCERNFLRNQMSNKFRILYRTAYSQQLWIRQWPRQTNKTGSNVFVWNRIEVLQSKIVELWIRLLRKVWELNDGAIYTTILRVIHSDFDIGGDSSPYREGARVWWGGGGLTRYLPQVLPTLKTLPIHIKECV